MASNSNDTRVSRSITRLTSKCIKGKMEFQIDNFKQRMERMIDSWMNREGNEEMEFLKSDVQTEQNGNQTYKLALKIMPEESDDDESFNSYPIQICLMNESSMDLDIEYKYEVSCKDEFGRKITSSLGDPFRSIIPSNDWSYLTDSNRPTLLYDDTLLLTAHYTIFLEDNRSSARVYDDASGGNDINNLPSFLQSGELTDIAITFDEHENVEDVERRNNNGRGQHSSKNKRLKRDDGSDSEMIDENSRNIKCHKLVLALHSPVFRAMFNHEPNRKILPISDCDPKALKVMVDFMYNPKKEVQEKDLNQCARHVMHVAEKYDVQGLKRICEVCKEIN